MDGLIVIGILAVVYSYARAKERGMPWFSWGGREGRLYQLRAAQESMKLVQQAQSPWLYVRHPNGPEAKAFERLTELTHSPEVSQRMMRAAAMNRNSQGELWCIEKAIYDIQRDRMGAW